MGADQEPWVQSVEGSKEGGERCRVVENVLAREKENEEGEGENCKVDSK